MFCSNCGKPAAPNINFCGSCGFNLNGNQINKFFVASPGTRLANNILDSFIYLIFCFVVGLVWGLTGLEETFSINDMNEVLLSLSLFLIYYFLPEFIWQRTPAKWITKTKVVTKDGKKPGALTILGRSFARLIPFDAFSFLFSPSGWHDRLSKTLVVPANYTEEEVRLIDISKNSGKPARTGIIILVCVFIGIAVIGLLSSIVLLALNSARAKSRDAQRLADVRSISSTLELYYNDMGSYPANLSGLVPVYLAQVPKAPTPPDGDCGPIKNEYRYELLGNKSYNLFFCLGQDAAGYSAGEHSMNSNGIDSNGFNNTSPSTNVADDEWQTFASPQEFFRVSFPTTPKRALNSSKNEAGILAYTATYTSEVSNEEAYLVVVNTYDQEIDISDPDESLDQGLKGMLATSPDNELIDSKYLYFGDDRALDFTILQNLLYIKGRIIMHDQVTFAVMYAYTASEYNEAGYNKFLDSFDIIE